MQNIIQRTSSPSHKPCASGRSARRTGARPHSSAFTLIEILVSLAIMALIFGISITFFSSITKQQSLDKDLENTYSYIERARNQTVTGEGATNYGVHFASTSITMFTGKTYTANATSNVMFLFNNKTYLYSTSMNGYDMYFKKVTGEPSATGTLIYKSRLDSNLSKTLTIYGSGLVEVR